MLSPRTYMLLWGVMLLGWTGTCQGQQNLFNVPSGVITKHGDLFFQEQINFAEPTGQSNTTIDFGLGDDWEVGFNVLDVLIYDDVVLDPFARHQENPDLMVNFQKGFHLIDDIWDVGVGGQFGFNPTHSPRTSRFENFVWAINSFEIPDHQEWGKWYCGPYAANIAYGGEGDRWGTMIGGEVPLIPDKLHFQFDYLSGKRDISVLVVGGVYTFRSGWQLSLGSQLPSPGSGNPPGIVLELTYAAFPLFRH